jgi:hypothetical protein
MLICNRTEHVVQVLNWKRYEGHYERGRGRYMKFYKILFGCNWGGGGGVGKFGESRLSLVAISNMLL